MTTKHIILSAIVIICVSTVSQARDAHHSNIRIFYRQSHSHHYTRPLQHHLRHHYLRHIHYRTPIINTVQYIVPVSATMTPVTTAVVENNHRYCREFIKTIAIAGEKQQGYGQACRQPDGTWEIIE